MSGNRTENATKNLTTGIVSKAILLGATFLVRTLFIRILGAEYTGISSLYSNILSLLNLAELGFGSVLTYELYKPLKDNDTQSIMALVCLFKKIYTVIIFAVLGIGLCLIPFLKYIINSTLDEGPLLTYYVLYLIDSVASYFVVYRTMVIEADQRKYITTAAEIASKFLMYIVQSIYLVLTRDFLGYLLLQVCFTVLKNVSLHLISLKLYPFLKEAKDRKAVPQEVLNRIKRNVKAMFIAKVSGVVLTQTDSIIISVLFGTIYVGYYSNYNMIIVYLCSIYNLVMTSVEASIGNLNAEANAEKSYNIYLRMDFLVALLNAFCVAEFICVIQDFINVWIGPAFLQGEGLVLALMFTFYLQQSMNVVATYRQTLGLFDAVKRIYPIMAVLNIVLSLALGRLLGISGVVLATGLSRLATVYWYEGKIVFESLRHEMKEYVLQQLKNAAVMLLTVSIAWGLSAMLQIPPIVAIFAKTIIVVLSVLFFQYVFFHKTGEWQWVKGYIKQKVQSFRTN